VVLEHINDFKKGLRQVTFFNSGISIEGTCYDVNKDVFDNRLLHKDKIEVLKTVEDLEANIVSALVGNKGVGIEEEEVPNE